jgi:hypothetical protein
MTIDFEPIVFRILAAPDFDKKKEKKIQILLAITGILALYMGIFLLLISYWLLILNVIVFAGILFYGIKRSKKTIFNFIYIGTLTIDKDGFHVYSSIKYSFNFEAIRFVSYEYDRPEYDGRMPPAKCYKMKFLMNDGKLFIIYPERLPFKKENNLCFDFPATMEILRKKNHFLYRMIKDADLFYNVNP